MPTKVTILLTLLLAAGCGSGGSGGGQGTPTVMPHGMSGMAGMSETAATTTSPGASAAASGTASAATSGTASGSEAGGAIPDACTLVTPAELGSLIGQELAAGTPRSTSPERAVCMYPSGAIIAVEVANHYEASRTLIEELGRTTEDVRGIGTAAFYDPAGQVVAKGEKVFVAVTVFGAPRVRLAAAAAVVLAAAE